MRNLLAFLACLFLAQAAFADEAAARKDRSITQLLAEGVPVLYSLPGIETTATSPRRDPEEVIQRTIALAIVAVKGETGDHAMGLALIDQFDAAGYFTPAEQAFMDNPARDQQDRIQFTWRYEGVHVMLWALGIYDELGRPDQITDVPLLAETLRDLGPEGLRAKARLRPQDQLLDAADLIYRYDWAVVSARLKGEDAPAGLDGGVVYERHYALNWLIGYMGQAWDDISTDT
ncbi:MAG: DUF4272 domain-containing protein [Rhodobacteraceae bacterium]|nr:DUF4272 domain-containing protein [Paracoccaceae bacterium]